MYKKSSFYRACFRFIMSLWHLSHTLKMTEWMQTKWLCVQTCISYPLILESIENRCRSLSRLGFELKKKKKPAWYCWDHVQAPNIHCTYREHISKILSNPPSEMSLPSHRLFAPDRNTTVPPVSWELWINYCSKTAITRFHFDWD